MRQDEMNADVFQVNYYSWCMFDKVAFRRVSILLILLVTLVHRWSIQFIHGPNMRSWDGAAQALPTGVVPGAVWRS